MSHLDDPFADRPADQPAERSSELTAPVQGGSIPPSARLHESERLPAGRGPLDDPGLPSHVGRRADTDPRAAKRAERQIAGLFGLATLSILAFLVCYVQIPRDAVVFVPVIGDTSASNLVLGVLLGVALFSIGAGAIQWAKVLMPDVEVVSERHSLTSSPEDREDAIAAFREGVEGSGFGRRPLIFGSLAGALGALLLAPIVLLRDLGPLPEKSLRTTLFTNGTRLVNDVSGEALRPEDLTIGTLVNGVPEGIEKAIEEAGNLNPRTANGIILVRMRPEEIRSQQGDNWDYQGILCFSKICTHVGCPVSLYEQQTHHLLCPCHQSTFDLADGATVIFGPAARRLPQLAITVNDEGELVSRQGFTEPVGPSFWERG